MTGKTAVCTSKASPDHLECRTWQHWQTSGCEQLHRCRAQHATTRFYRPCITYMVLYIHDWIYLNVIDTGFPNCISLSCALHLFRETQRLWLAVNDKQYWWQLVEVCPNSTLSFPQRKLSDSQTNLFDWKYGQGVDGVDVHDLYAKIPWNIGLWSEILDHPGFPVLCFASPSSSWPEFFPQNIMIRNVEWGTPLKIKANQITYQPWNLGGAIFGSMA